MKALLLFVIGLLSLAQPTFAQTTATNFGASLTLSGGQCAEVIPADTLRRIGRHAYSPVTGRAYRFGFNGKENDNEVHNAPGTSYAYEYGMHDPRVGRFLSIDPLAGKYAHQSPYAFSSNRVIDRVEMEGLEDGKFDATFRNNWKTAKALYPGDFNKQHEYVMQCDKAAAFGALAGLVLVGGGYVAAPYLSTITAGGIAASTESAILTAPLWAPEAASFAANLFYEGIDDPFPTPGPGGEAGKLFRGAGKWVSESTAGWSGRAKFFQETITGVRAGNAFEVNGVKFDGLVNGVLVEAKSSYDGFVNKSGQFSDWFTGKADLIDQARRQIGAADGAKIEWHFATEKSMNATKDLFAKEGIEGIEFVHSPIE